MSERRPSMAEVAKSIGVSHQTVSRVVNGLPNVRPETREKVERAIAELGYRRNNAARTLVTRKSGLIGVVAVGSYLYGPRITLAGLEEAARKHGYDILLSTLAGARVDDLNDAINTCVNRSVEAIVVIATKDELVRHSQTLDVGVPVMVIGSGDNNPKFPNILGVDQEEGGRLAARHVIGLGHKRIAIMAGPEDWLDALQRLKGASSECSRAGITPEIFEGSWNSETGYELGVSLSMRPLEKRPSALIMPNDATALGVLLAFSRTGVRVPEDISVVGFDDIPESEFFHPPLTTIRQDFSLLGRQVMEAVLECIRGERPSSVMVAPTLSLRSSTAVMQ
ncbi:LacI family DNA-binding transcriptional regulator [Rothia aerolata]|uniref:LacI family DNA-binding transcriptional regulator n=1 Tax=Rothia aerolata TaxID=1812262 RepID=UPI00166D2891|nr:LacI family DNA-binding transcriptional regulator [Rothia aerolata]